MIVLRLAADSALAGPEHSMNSMIMRRLAAHMVLALPELDMNSVIMSGLPLTLPELGRKTIRI